MQSVQGAITSLDLTVIAIYLVIVIAIGIWVSKQTKTGEDLFLGGRSLTWGQQAYTVGALTQGTTNKERTPFFPN